MGFVIWGHFLKVPWIFFGDLCWMISFICTQGEALFEEETWLHEFLLIVWSPLVGRNAKQISFAISQVFSQCWAAAEEDSLEEAGRTFYYCFGCSPTQDASGKWKFKKYSKINPGGYWVEGNNNKQLRITSPTPFQAQSSPLLLPPRMGQVTSRSSSVGILEVWSFEFFSIPTVEHLRWKQPTLLKAGLKPPRDHQHVVSLESWVMLGWPTWAKNKYRTNKTCMPVWLHVRWTNISQWPLGHIMRLSHRR